MLELLFAVFDVLCVFALICEEKDGDSSRMDENEHAFAKLFGGGDAGFLFWRVLYFCVGGRSHEPSDEYSEITSNDMFESESSSTYLILFASWGLVL